MICGLHLKLLFLIWIPISFHKVVAGLSGVKDTVSIKQKKAKQAKQKDPKIGYLILHLKK